VVAAQNIRAGACRYSVPQRSPNHNVGAVPRPDNVIGWKAGQGIHLLQQAYCMPLSSNGVYNTSFIKTSPGLLYIPPKVQLSGEMAVGSPLGKSDMVQWSPQINCRPFPKKM
jgi:hypothetical protein